MHTLTFTQRFGLPAFIAASIHVVVLFAFNHPVVRFTSVEELPAEVTKIIPITLEPLAPPPDPHGDKTAEVRPLAQGAVVPESVDNSKHSGPITMPVVVVPTSGAVDVKLDRISPNWAPGGEHDGTGISGAREMFPSAQLDNLPRAKVQVSPVYPPALRQTGVEGTVMVEFDVDRAGNVIAARALQSSQREFEAPAVAAVLKWKFEPGRRHGRTVGFRMVVPIGFTITAD